MNIKELIESEKSPEEIIQTSVTELFATRRKDFEKLIQFSRDDYPMQHMYYTNQESFRKYVARFKHITPEEGELIWNEYEKLSSNQKFHTVDDWMNWFRKIGIKGI